MTAEIAILNKSAVALAADSKVTIGGGQKTFDTVNKIFTLSKIHPIGIMVFGNAEFMDYPWETIVKLYRAQKGAAGEATVDAWGKDFIGYLKGFGKIRASDKEENITDILTAWFYELYQASVREAREDDVQIPSDEFTQILCRLLSKQVSNAEERSNLFPNSYRKHLQSGYGASVDKLIQLSFGGYESQELIDLATRFSWLALQKKLFSPVSSGIVFAGFGLDEKFPTVIQYDTDGYVGNAIKIARDRSADISRNVRSSIIPFAQIEMVQRFMNGIDPDYGRALHRSFISLLVDNCLTVLEKYGDPGMKTDDIRIRITKAVFKSWSEHLKTTRLYQAEKFF